MIAFERIKELAKNRKMSLREVNDKAKLDTNIINNWQTKAHKINTYGVITMIWVRSFTDNNYFLFLLAIL